MKKTGKEYAQKLADAIIFTNDPDPGKEHAHEKTFISGYLKACEETGVEEMAEALYDCKKAMEELKWPSDRIMRAGRRAEQSLKKYNS